MRRKIAVLLVVSAAVGSGCSSQETSDELMVTDNPVAAAAAVSPPATTAPAGTVVPFDATVTALAFEPTSRTLVVGTDEPASVRLFQLGDALTETRTIAQSDPSTRSAGSVESLTVVGRSVFAAIDNTAFRLDLPGGDETWGQSVRGTVTSATTFDGRTLMSVRDEPAVAVVEEPGNPRLITGSLMSADQVLSNGRDVAVLDRLRNALFMVDVPGMRFGEGLRTGKGATNAVTDRFGRVLVVDTRGDALLALSLDPLLLRQNYPVAGGPYGIAYDPERDIAWVTLTETNEVVGYEVAGEQPKEKYRFPTVSQPNTVAVDPESGRVIVASGTGDGIQVISI